MHHWNERFDIILDTMIDEEYLGRVTLEEASELLFRVEEVARTTCEEYLVFLRRWADGEVSMEEIDSFIGTDKVANDKLNWMLRRQQEVIGMIGVLGCIAQRDQVREEYCKRIGIEPELIF